MSTSQNHDLTLSDPHAGQDRQQSQSPPDVYAARIERLNASATKWSEARRVQRERMNERRGGR